MRVVLADGDADALRRLVAHCESRDGVSVTAACSEGARAQRIIAREAPDVAILDAALPGVAGLEIAAWLNGARTVVVISSRARADAAAAFDVGAVDFLTKPIPIERFDRALARARERLDAAGARERLAKLQARVVDTIDGRDDELPDDFWVKDRGRVMRIGQEEIEWVEAERDYVRLHVDGRSWLVRETMQRMESRLDPQRFMRVHRSAIVNSGAVRMARTTASGARLLRLQSGAEVRVGRSYESRLTRLIGARDR